MSHPYNSPQFFLTPEQQRLRERAIRYDVLPGDQEHLAVRGAVSRCLKRMTPDEQATARWDGFYSPTGDGDPLAEAATFVTSSNRRFVVRVEEVPYR